jgi:HK97 family phage portal protein
LVEGYPHIFTVDEVAHWAPNPDPEAKFKGMSWLTPVAREINADLGMTQYKQQYLNNAASPNILIKYSQRLGDATVKRIRERVESKHSGIENAFGTLVLDEGADVTIIGNTFEQMNFATVQAAGENRILIASGVPGIVVGSKEGLMAATYSNYEQAMRRFADITMRPLWRSACAALAKLVTVPTGSRLWYNTTDIAALRQGEKEMADTMLVHANAAKALKDAGYKPDSIIDALSSGDLTLLVYDKTTDDPPSPPALPPGLNGLGNGKSLINGTPQAIGASA